jgi:hypothetical protein
MSDKALRRARDRGDLHPLSSQVLAFAGSPASEMRSVMAAVLDAGPGAAVSFQTGASMWGFPGYELLPAQTLIRRGRRGVRPSLGEVHTTCWIRPNHVTELHGMRVVNPARLCFDLSGKVHSKKLERLVDAGWSRGLLTYEGLHEMYDDMARRGRPRTTVMKSILADRPADYVPPESGTEARFQQIAREAGLDQLRRQVDSGDDHGWIGRMDFRHQLLPFVVQVDSDLYHAALFDARRACEQTARLDAAGYIVLRVREFDIWHNRQVVERQLRDALDQARRRAA